MTDQRLARLDAVIADRLGNGDAASSYVASVAAKGAAHAARKLGEEAVETVIAALDGDRATLVAESADLLFHLAILLHLKGATLEDVLAELDRRDGVSGHAEKAARVKE